MNRTSIEWCRTYRPDGSYEHGFTTNPVRFMPNTPATYTKQPTVTMCQKVSPGCANCYAESITRRFWPKAAGKFPGYTAQGVASGIFELNTAELETILRHKKPCRLFWGDMTDLFQESIPDNFLDKCFAVCALTPHITHIFLTKRAERMQKYLSGRYVSNKIFLAAGSLVGGLFADDSGWEAKKIVALLEGINGLARNEHGHIVVEIARPKWPLPNSWLGTSVENQEQADKRIPLLQQTPAAVRFISAEPLLCELEVARWFAAACGDAPWLDWVICGGESGTGARPMHPDWARSLRHQCQAAGVPFFFKQWGELLPVDSRTVDRGQIVRLDDACFERVGKKAAGAVLDGREWREFPGVRGKAPDYSGSAYLSGITEDACL